MNLLEQFHNEFESALQTFPQGLTDVGRAWRTQFEERHPQIGLNELGAPVAPLARLVVLSEFAGRVLLRQPDALAGVDTTGGYRSAIDFDAVLGPPPEHQADRDTFMRALRRYRNRGLLRVLWQEFVVAGDVEPSLLLLSELAERCIAAAVSQASSSAEARFGRVLQDGLPAPLIVLAMGKLGGRELNLSSDVDIVFLYSGSAASDGPRSLSAQQFFERVARDVIDLLEQVTADGFVYRVDTRLRPFGQSGPPVMNLASLERYLVEHGRDWERYAYVKARPLATSSDAAPEHPAIARLQRDIVKPFVYRRYLDYGVFESLRDMHGRIVAEVGKRETADNIKLGSGGIREIEFVVQALQLLRGGNHAELQTPELRTAIFAAVNGRDWNNDDARTLIESYDFLRRIENLVQGFRDQQTHDLPAPGLDRDRLVIATGFKSWEEFLRRLNSVRDVVRRHFSEVGLRDAERQDQDETLQRTETLWSARASSDEWRVALDSIGMTEPELVAERLAAFREAATSSVVDAVAAPRLRRFVANLLVSLIDREYPGIVLDRVLGIAESVLRRSAYLALLNENPVVLQRLIELCQQSGYLARELGRFPALLDEMIGAEIFEKAPSNTDLEKDLEAELAGHAGDAAEDRLNSLALFRRNALFRIAVADVSDVIPIMKVSDRLTHVAELVLREALELARRDLLRQFGQPCCYVDGVRRPAEFGIIAYGKLAGFELSYTSDLDLVFVHDSAGEEQVTDGERSIDNAVYFARLIRRLMHLLSTRTVSGTLYEVDTRLRPSGRSGLLVTTLDAFEKYQANDAWTWEHQALLRSRPVAGGQQLVDRFFAVREITLRERIHRETLSDDVQSMRARMRETLDRSDADRFDLKHGRGGIGDIEFIVQYLVLKHAHDHPALIRYPDVIRQIEALESAGCIEAAGAKQLRDAYRLLRNAVHRLALDDRKPFGGYADYAECRKLVTEVWQAAFGAAPP